MKGGVFKVVNDWDDATYEAQLRFNGRLEEIQEQRRLLDAREAGARDEFNARLQGINQRFDENMESLSAMDRDCKERFTMGLEGLSSGGVDGPPASLGGGGPGVDGC